MPSYGQSGNPPEGNQAIKTQHRAIRKSDGGKSGNQKHSTEQPGNPAEGNQAIKNTTADNAGESGNLTEGNQAIQNTT